MAASSSVTSCTDELLFSKVNRAKCAIHTFVVIYLGFVASHTWSKPFTLRSYSLTCYSGQIAVKQVQEALALSMPALLNASRCQYP